MNNESTQSLFEREMMNPAFRRAYEAGKKKFERELRRASRRAKKPRRKKR